MTQGDKIVLDGVRAARESGHAVHEDVRSGAHPARLHQGVRYIEGDVDFIFGRATLVLDGCTVHYLTARQASKGGYLVAPSTDARNPFGILINDSELTAEEGTPADLVFLGRAWDESQMDLPTYTTNIATGAYPNGQVLIRNSTLGSARERGGTVGAVHDQAPLQFRSDCVPGEPLLRVRATTARALRRPENQARFEPKGVRSAPPAERVSGGELPCFVLGRVRGRQR